MNKTHQFETYSFSSAQTSAKQSDPPGHPNIAGNGVSPP